jgi:hypothetical protein
MIIWGWGGGTPKHLGDVAPVVCPNCQNQVFYEHVSSTKWFRLYFIPLIPYSTKHLLLCPVCTRGAQLSAPQKDQVLRMKAVTSSWKSKLLTDEKYGEAVQGFWPSLFPSTTSSVLPSRQSQPLPSGTP